MTSVALYKQDGSQNGNVDLNADIFGIEPNDNVVFDTILMQRASMRQEPTPLKTGVPFVVVVRSHGVKGYWSCRQGSIRSPQWVGGGVVFGPTPRSYSYRLPKKVGRLALKSVLSQKVLDESLVVLDGLAFDAPKTKELLQCWLV